MPCNIFREIAKIDRKLNLYFYHGPPWRVFRVCVIFVIIPLCIVYIFLLLASGTDSDIMKHNQGKYLEHRIYAGESADFFTLPGNGFSMNGIAQIKIEAGYSTLVSSHFGDRTMMYIYICQYDRYLDAWKSLLNGRRPVRVSGRVREDKSICTTEFYHKGNEEVGCRSFPLKVNNQNETIRYQASATIDTKMDFMQSSSDASESKYYTVLLMNCEIKGSSYTVSRDCPESLNAAKDPYNTNCTRHPPFRSEGLWYSYKYTYINEPPAYYLSTTQVPFLTMLNVGLWLWIIIAGIWILNTYIFRNESGIRLQWHMTIFVVLKPIVLAYRLLFWDTVRLRKHERKLNFFMVMTLATYSFYYIILWETLMRISHGWMITKHRLSGQGKFHLYVSVLIWGFGNFVFNYFYLFQNEGLGIVTVDLAKDMVAYYFIAFALLATGVSYTIILMTVCLATSNLSHQMSDQIHALQTLGMPASGTAVSNRKKMFVYLSVGFTCYLLALFIAWFSVLAIDDSTLYYPWLNDCIEESLEVIFLVWVLVTFRARKFNTVALQTQNMRGGGLGPVYEMANRDDIETVVSTRVCIVNPTENEELYMTKLSFGVPAENTLNNQSSPRNDEERKTKYKVSEEENGGNNP